MNRIEAVCHRNTGLVSLSQVCAIPDGYVKNRSQVWHLTIPRAWLFHRLRLIDFDHEPGIGRFGYGSVRTKSRVAATKEGRDFLKLCEEAARQSNLHMPPFYSDYLIYPKDFAERKGRFKEALSKLTGV